MEPQQDIVPASMSNLPAMAPLGGPMVMQGSVNTQGTAVATYVAAMVSARVQSALNRPRSMNTVRVKLLEECSRPKFAEEAIYSKPVGRDFVRGFSIRFAEAILRLIGNVDVDAKVIQDDFDLRIIRVSVLDLETNLCMSSDVTLQKTVERNSVRQGQVVVGQRQNTNGGVVFSIRASEDELTVKQNAAVSKTLRNAALRLIPADILEECEEKVKETLEQQTSSDPKAANKKLQDSYYKLGVSPADLEKYLGYPIDQINPQDFQNLRLIYSGIKNGETRWADVVAKKDEERGTSSSDTKTLPAGNAAARVFEKAGKKREPVPVPASAPLIVDAEARTAPSDE